MQVYQYDQVESTQDLAKDYLKNKNKKKAAFVAQSQTNGYGKRGRFFYSPAQTGIYFSMAFPNFEIVREKINLLTPCIATNVVDVLRKFYPQKDFRLKWVNDIYLKNKKVAGILTEYENSGLIIGVGINIATHDFPEQIRFKAGYISDTLFEHKKMTNELLQAVDLASKNYGQNQFMEQYRKLSWLIGKRVNLKLGKKEVTGLVRTIDDAGKLVILTNNEAHSFSSGEVTKVELT